MRFSWIGAAVLSMALSGCGGDSPEEALRDAADEVHEAREARDAAAREVVDAAEDLADVRDEVKTAEAALAKARTQLRRQRVELRGEEADLAAAATDVAVFRLLQRRLLDAPELNGLAINVAVFDGDVTLSGEAASADQREAAQRIARSVPGVGEIDNQIDVTKRGGS